MNVIKNLAIWTILSPTLLYAEMIAPITAEEISRLLQFSGEIIVSDKTEELSGKHGDAILSALLFEPDDDGFSRIQALTTKGGFLLDPARRERLERSAPAVRKIQLESGVEGYAGLEGAGPGGEGYIAIAHLPEKNIDVQFKIIISNDGASPDSSEEIAKYHSILRDGGELQSALHAVLAQGVTNLAKYERLDNEPESNASSNAGRTEENAPAARPNRGNEAEPESSIAAEAEAKPSSSSRMWWLVGGGALALVSLLAVFLKKRKL